MKQITLSLFVFSVLVGCAHKTKTVSDVKVLSISQVSWEKLNPARGDQSPQAATLWGDRNGKEATGFLVKFADGFSSPPHIHNVSYKGIVLSGLIHNDDPGAANMWMPQGSFWTQPAGEVHITSARVKKNIAFIEIDNGPYLVKPTKQAFDSGEKPMNIHKSNIIWLNNRSFKKVELWKNSQKISGSMIKFKNKIKLQLENAKLVLIHGELTFQNQNLKPGSLISIREKSQVRFLCQHPSDECIFYLRSNEKE